LEECKNGNLERVKYLTSKVTDKSIIKFCFKKACRSGNLGIVKFFINSKFNIAIEKVFFEKACISNNLKLIDYLYQKIDTHFEINKDLVLNILRNSFDNDFILKILRHSIDNYSALLVIKYLSEELHLLNNIFIDKTFIFQILALDKLDVAKFFITKKYVKFKKNEVIYFMISIPNLTPNILDYLIGEVNIKKDEFIYWIKIFINIIKSNNIESLEFLIKKFELKFLDIDSEDWSVIILAACVNNKLSDKESCNLLNILVNHFIFRPFLFIDNFVVSKILKKGNFECAKYINERFGISENTRDFTLLQKYRLNVNYFLKNLMFEYKNVKNMYFKFNLYTLRRVFLSDQTELAIKGFINVYKFSENDIHYDDDYIFKFSCINGCDKSIKFLLKNYTFSIDILRKNDCEILIDTCLNNKLSTIQLLLNEFPITSEDIRCDDNRAFKFVCVNGWFEMAKFLKEKFNLTSKDLEMSHDRVYKAAFNQNKDLFNWLVKVFKLDSEKILDTTGIGFSGFDKKYLPKLY